MSSARRSTRSPCDTALRRGSSAPQLRNPGAARYLAACRASVPYKLTKTRGTLLRARMCMFRLEPPRGVSILAARLAVFRFASPCHCQHCAIVLIGDAKSSHDSLSTPANPLSTSPTPIPSDPALSLTSLSRSSSLFVAVPSTRSATRSAVLRYCSILCTPSANRSILGSRVWLSLVRCDCSAAGVVKVNVNAEGVVC